MTVLPTTMSRLALTGALCASVLLGACGPEDGGNTENEEESSTQTLDLEINQLEEGTYSQNARLVIAWAQLDDDGPDPDPVIAYDAAFDPAATTVAISTDEIANPTEPVLLCTRECDDESQCGCTEDSSIEAGLGLVLVMNDPNQNGSIEIDELMQEDEWRGVGRVILGWSPETVADADNTEVFQSDLLEGLNPYAIDEESDDTFDRLKASDFDTTFELAVCPEDSTTCELPFPNLT